MLVKDCNSLYGGVFECFTFVYNYLLVSPLCPVDNVYKSVEYFKFRYFSVDKILNK